MQSYNNAYTQGMVDLQTYLIQQSHVKRSIKNKYNEFIESHEFIDSTESESPSQITRLIVANDVSPFLGIASRISITCAQCEKESILNLYIAKQRKEIMRKAINQDTLQSTTFLFLPSLEHLKISEQHQWHQSVKVSSST